MLLLCNNEKFKFNNLGVSLPQRAGGRGRLSLQSFTPLRLRKRIYVRSFTRFYLQSQFLFKL